jgi:hypothetical protein
VISYVHTHTDAQEFWMSLENEFAVDIHDVDIRKAQAFYAAVRMIHVRLCKVADIHMNIHTAVGEAIEIHQ